MTDSAIGAATDGWSAYDSSVWPADAGQLAAMRAAVHRWLAPFGLSDDTEHDVVLAVSEAATNAVEHAYPPDDPDGRVELTFWCDDESLHIAVVDRGTWREPPTGPRSRGFGLPMMRRLVAAVAIEHAGRGTRVVLRHPLDRPEPTTPGGAGRR